MKSKIKVLVFDDEDKRREGLELLIGTESEFQFVGALDNCSDVVNAVQMAEPDVILMDLDMPEVNGIQGIRLLRSHQIHVSVIVQTIIEDDDKVFSAIRAGANGYILKQTHPVKLLEAIAEVANGGAPMSPSIAKKVLGLFRNKIQPTRSKTGIILSKREQEILEYLVKGYSYKMIAEACFISYPTVNSHISNIYKKLHVDSAAGAVSKALREGLVD
jgi:DNA-binding NarL/FixJ family response regulator